MKLARLAAAAVALGGCSLLVPSPDDYTYTRSIDGGMDASVDAGPAPEAGVDAGPPMGDGGDCAPETCNGEDDDCDGTTDEEPTECGGPNETTTCGSGRCEVDGCASGFGDCNADPGCETDVTDSDTNCGTCGMACTEFGESCVSGACGYPEIRDVVVFASDGDAWPNALHIGPGGEMTIAMRIDGSVDLPGRSVSSTGNAAAVIRLSPDRSSTEWAEVIQASDDTTATDVDVSSSGITYATGEYRGSITVDGETHDTGPMSFGWGFVWSLDSSGTLRRFVSLEAGDSVLPTALVHMGGISFVGGESSGDFIFADNSLGSSDAALASVPDSGTVAAEVYGGTGSDRFASLTLAADGSLVATGSYEVSADFGGGSLPGAAADGSQFVLAVYDSFGVLDWALGAGSPGSDGAGPVATDDASNIFWTAYPGGGIDVGGGPTTPIDGNYVLVGSHTRAGEYRWERQFRNLVVGDAVTRGSELVLCGTVTPRAGPSGDISPEGDVPYEGSSDGIVIALDRDDGGVAWLRTWGGPGVDVCTAVETGPAGEVWVLARSNDTVVLDGSTHTPTADFDGFLFRVVP